MSLPYYYATLSHSSALSAVSIFAGSLTKDCPALPGGSCTNYWNLLASPIGGSGSYDFLWELVGSYGSLVILTGTTLQTASLSVESNVPNTIGVIIQCTVTDTVRSDVADGQVEVTSVHEAVP